MNPDITKWLMIVFLIPHVQLYNLDSKLYFCVCECAALAPVIDGDILSSCAKDVQPLRLLNVLSNISSGHPDNMTRLFTL